MKLVVWYHCLLSGPRIPHPAHTTAILAEQMAALHLSGLADAADEIHVGVNGPDADALTVACYCPDQSQIHTNGPQAESELATMTRMQQSLEPGCAVLYHHIKGAQYPRHPVWNNWRRCMQQVCVYGWEDCVTMIEGGADTVGAHWMNHKKWMFVHPTQRYWGGNFWWASSDYLLTLPPMAKDSVESRYEAEVWIGKGPQKPKIVDFAPHLPFRCPVIR